MKENKKKKTGILTIIKPILAVVAIVCIVYFAHAELKKSSIQFMEIFSNLDWFFLLLAFLMLCLFYFLSALTFRFLLNRDAQEKISVTKAFGASGISGLTKYIPGRVWSYAILFSILKKNGITLKKAIFDSYINMVLTITTPILMMLPIAIFFYLPEVELWARILLMIATLGLYGLCLVLSPLIIRFTIHVVNRFKKEPIEYTPITKTDIFKAQAIKLIAYLFYSLCVAAIIFSIDSSLDISSVLVLSIACVFSMAVGLLVFIVPAGLGVQEYLVFVFASLTLTDIGFLIALPIVFRIVSLATDVVMGLISLWIVRAEIKGLVFSKREGSDLIS